LGEITWLLAAVVPGKYWTLIAVAPETVGVDETGVTVFITVAVAGTGVVATNVAVFVAVTGTAVAVLVLVGRGVFVAGT
jgi:hypothetical protein